MILVTEWVQASELARLAPYPVTYRPELGQDREQLLDAVGQAAALVVRNLTRVDGELLARAPHLQVVGRLGSGLDNIDEGALRGRGIELVWAPGDNAAAVAEATLAMLLTAVRRWDLIWAKTRQGAWRRDWPGSELRGRTLAVIGYGHVGQAVAARAAALGLSVLVADPRLSPHHALVDTGALRVLEVGHAVAAADFVSLHVPLRPDTRHLVDRRLLARFRPGAWLINTSRGEVVDEEALLEALDSGRLAGACLDVRRHEPPGRDDRLLRHPQVLSSPHVAGLTEDAQRRIHERVLEGVRALLAVREPVNAAPPREG